MISLLNSDSDSEIEIKINEDYAEKYDNWRRNEELQKLKDRYGEKVEAAFHESSDDSSTSEDEDKNPEQFSKEFDKQFFQALACVKKKDSRIYDENMHFFTENENDIKLKKSTPIKNIEKPFLLRDYERKLLLKKDKNSSSKAGEDSDETAARPESPTIVQEERAIKQSFRQVMLASDDEDGDGSAWGGLFQKRHKSKAEMEKEEEDYKAWMKGQKEELADKDTESELKFLRDYWNDPNLDSNEQFLRDYILNDRYLEKDIDKDYIPTYEEIVHDSDENLSEDEKTIQQQEEFEHKFNFRFEEPDQEFIKQYPRTVEHSLRRKDERRKRKRQEIRERREAEKCRKIEELKQLKALKRKEIMEKIEKLKEITGNEELGIKDEDLEGDFDPAEYDHRMQQIFDDSYYNEEEGDQKPEFPELDEELEIENWNKWTGGNDIDDVQESEINEPHCEDPDFNMDCEYDNSAGQNLQDDIRLIKGKKKGRKKSKFAQVVAKKKPIFDPKDRTFDDYVEEYYKLDFEDLIGDLPCRFKYRNVMPNNFGLSLEEVLKADDKELNRWCSLKKAVQYRPEHVEKYDVQAYQRKARNEQLKMKTFQSLYAATPKQNENVDQANQKQKAENATVKKKNKKPKKRKHEESENNHNFDVYSSKPKKLKQRVESQNSKGESMSAECSMNGSVSPTATLRSKGSAYETVNNNDAFEINQLPSIVTTDASTSNKIKKKKKKSKQMFMDSTDFTKLESKDKHLNGNCANKHGKKQKNHHTNKLSKMSEEASHISDARLRAYGINPKKYKNRLKYGKQLN